MTELKNSRVFLSFSPEFPLEFRRLIEVTGMFEKVVCF